MRRYSVITDRCNLDLRCVSACLRKAIHPTENEPAFHNTGQLFINPGRCVGCSACVSACKNGAIFEIQELPEGLHHFARINAAYYAPHPPGASAGVLPRFASQLKPAT